MGIGIDFVNRIDELLDERNMSRKDISDILNIAPTTIPNWKTADRIPAAETVKIIADKLEVSAEWLMFGNSFFPKGDESLGSYSRKAVRNRVYEKLAKKLKVENADTEELHKVWIQTGNLTYRALKNWSLGRCNIDLYVFINIACTLGTNINYLLMGADYDVPDNFDESLYKEAVENMNAVRCLANLTGKRKQTSLDVINQMMEFEDLEYKSKTNS